MNTYSSPIVIEEFIARIITANGRTGCPTFVNDLDGNLLLGYSLAPGYQLPLGPHDNPQKQTIPFGSTQEQIREWVRKGYLVEGIFAGKPMDARLPAELVGLINTSVGESRPFDIAFLTSRSDEDAIILLRESGIEHPEQLTLVANSGATLYLHGTRHDVRKLTDDERAFLDRIDSQMCVLNSHVQKVVNELGYDVLRCPDLHIEAKGIAKNVHYRQVLTTYGQKEGSILDVRIGTLLETELRKLVENGLRGPDGSLTFTTLDGPATVEVKVASIHKGHGLRAIAAAAAQAPLPPTAIVFAGDDVSKGNGSPGTDYFAMIDAPAIALNYGIPTYNIHTLHPISGSLDGTEPDMRKAITALSKQYPAPKLDLCVPSPQALASLIINTYNTIKDKCQAAE